MMKRELNWDGEKIKEVVPQEEKKHDTKDILNGLDHVRGELNKFAQSKAQFKQQMHQLDNQIKQASTFEKELTAFEAKCIELQKEKIQHIIKVNHKECYDKAVKSSSETIAKSPDSYDDRQKKQLPYLDYQKLLAQLPKMAEKIANRMIRIYLFEEPIFDNPFKD